MNPLAFYALATVALAAAVGAAFLKSTRLAAMALFGSLVAIALLVFTLAGWLAGLVLGVGAIGVAGILHLAHARTGGATAPEPSEERRYWAGLVSVLAFVLFFRVIAGSEWGTQDFSRLVANSRGAVPAAAGAGLLLLAALGAWALLRKEPA